MSEDLRAKYGAEAFDAGVKIQSKAFEKRLAQRDAIDQHFTRSWLDYQIKGLSQRPALDTRTRLLVLIGQYTMAKAQPLLDDTVRAAIAAKVPVREIAEIILQCQVYGGLVTVDPAIRTFHKIAEELNLLPALKKSQLPLDGTAGKRNRAEEEKKWHKDDVADPRTQPLIDKHGWLAVGTGLTMRPHHHINILNWIDIMDSDFAGLWVKFCYGDMYSRGIVDNKTRLLCMVGDCLAVGEATNSRGHMRGAMRQGASPREVMEVIFQTSANFGMPPAWHALENFLEILAEDGRLGEVGNPPMRVESYAK
ncbi:MAG TPA: carboxymuconolactone decarboxylase family protein [Burkholderiales bacterium]|nr:carboxymuconolactone decarboxylase family protein [Burkholderiales bacterium]